MQICVFDCSPRVAVHNQYKIRLKHCIHEYVYAEADMFKFFQNANSLFKNNSYNLYMLFPVYVFIQIYREKIKIIRTFNLCPIHGQNWYCNFLIWLMKKHHFGLVYIDR